MTGRQEQTVKLYSTGQAHLLAVRERLEKATAARDGLDQVIEKAVFRRSAFGLLELDEGP